MWLRLCSCFFSVLHDGASFCPISRARCRGCTKRCTFSRTSGRPCVPPGGSSRQLGPPLAPCAAGASSRRTGRRRHASGAQPPERGRKRGLREGGRRHGCEKLHGASPGTTATYSCPRAPPSSPHRPSWKRAPLRPRGTWRRGIHSGDSCARARPQTRAPTRVRAAPSRPFTAPPLPRVGLWGGQGKPRTDWWLSGPAFR